MPGPLFGRRPLPPQHNPAGGLPWGDLYPSAGGARGIAQPDYRPQRSIAIAAAPFLVSGANPSRRSLSVVCDGATTLYIGEGAQPAPSSLAVALGQGQTYVTAEPATFRGDVWALGAAAIGSARVAEST